MVWHLRGSEGKFGSHTIRNILGIIDFISQYEPILAEYLVIHRDLGPRKTSYSSKTIYEELIDGKRGF